MGRLDGKVIVISGGTKGLGRGLAIESAMQGANVVIGGRDKKAGDEICAEIEKKGGNKAIFVACDVTNVADCENLIAAAVKEFGKISGLVNYAGVLPVCDLVDTNEKVFDQVFDINVKGAYFCTQYAVKAMQKCGGGSIIFIGSMHAYCGDKDRAAYACSKATYLTLNTHIARHYSKDKIRSNFVSMGWVATPGELALRQTQGKDLAWLEETAAQAIPLGRLLTNEDHIPGIVYLLSDEAAMVTNSELRIDGGLISS